MDCSKCLEWKGEAPFAPHQRTAHSGKTRVCLDCAETKMCIACKLHRQRSAFSQGEWEHSAKQSAQGKCKYCTVTSEKGMWQCNVCSQMFNHYFYSRWRTKHGEQKTQLVRCNSCVYKDEQQHKHEQANTFAMVMKQDSPNTTTLTTSDQHAAESAAQHSTPATTVNVVVEDKTPISTVQI